MSLSQRVCVCARVYRGLAAWELPAPVCESLKHPHCGGGSDARGWKRCRIRSWLAVEMTQKLLPVHIRDLKTPQRAPVGGATFGWCSDSSQYPHLSKQRVSPSLFQASTGGRQRSATASVTSRTRLWSKPWSATESKSVAESQPSNSEANSKPYLLNSLGFNCTLRASLCHVSVLTCPSQDQSSLCFFF